MTSFNRRRTWACLQVVALLFTTIFTTLPGAVVQAQTIEPTIEVHDFGRILFLGFTPGSSVSFLIYEGSSLVGAETVYTNTDGNAAYTRFHLEPGWEIIATDDASAIAKTLIIYDIRIGTIDFAGDTISGTAGVGDEVVVHLNLDIPVNTITTITGGDGYWMADFSGIVDFLTDTPIQAARYDEDGDATVVFTPFLEASVSGDWIDVYRYKLDPTVTVEVFESEGGAFIDSFSVPINTHGEGKLVPEQIGFDIIPGMFITATGDSTGNHREVTILPLTFDVLDIDLDYAQGTAPPGAIVNVGAGGCGMGGIETDIGGIWEAYFACDVTTYIDNQATIRDEDGDSTSAEFSPPPPDSDGDGIPDMEDNCGDIPNPGQEDGDGDEIGDACDNCVLDFNPGQEDSNMNGIGDACDVPREKCVQTHYQYPLGWWGPDYDYISGDDWEIGSTVTLSIDDPISGLTYTDSQIVELGGDSGRFHFVLSYNVWDLKPGQTITLSDGIDTFTYVVQDFAITSTNVDTDVIQGYADPGSMVYVNAQFPFFMDGIPEYYETTVTADGTGFWEADLSGHFDIRNYTYGRTEQYEDSETCYSTTYDWWFQTDIEASLDHDTIRISHLKPFDVITIEIFDSFGAPDPYIETIETDENAHFWLNVGEFLDLHPGTFIRALDINSNLIKELEMSYLTLDIFDSDADYIEGKADPGQVVQINVHTNTGEEVASLEVITEASGIWSYTFSEDLTNDMEIEVRTLDEDNDATIVHAPEPQAQLVVVGNLTWDWINLVRFTPNASVTVEIYDAVGGPMIGDPHVVPTDVEGNGWFDGREFEINLQPTMLIVARDDASGEVKELILEHLSVDVFDIASDQVAGTGPAGATLWVNVHDEVLNEGYGMEVVADSGGYWLADFSAEGVDLNENMNPGAFLPDEDNDITVAEFPGFPYFEGNLPLDWVSAHFFTPYASVTLEIYEYEGGPHIAGSPFSVPTDWRGEVWFDGQENGVDLLPGMYLIIRDNDVVTLEKGLFLVDVTIDTPDFVNNELRGTGPADTWLTVEVYDHTNGEQYFVDVLTDGYGNWYLDFLAEFGVPIPSEDYCAHIKLYDEDGDASVADPPEPPEPPRINGSLVEDWIGLEGFEPETGVEVVIDGSAPFYFTTNEEGSRFVEPYEHEYDLVPGMIIAASQGEVTKTLVLEDITVDLIDYEEDILSGYAPEGMELEVNVWDEASQTGFGMPVVSEIGDVWTADFEPPEDIVESMWIGVMHFDEDGDATIAQPIVEEPPEPPFIVAITDTEQVFAAHWPLEEEVSLCLDYGPSPDGVCDYEATSIIFEAPWGWPITLFELDGIHDLQAGDIATVSGLIDGELVSKSLEVMYVEVTDVDMVADTVSGYADPDAKLRYVIFGIDPILDGSDGSGSWLADFSGLYDIVPGSSGLINNLEDALGDDGDYTEVSWVAVENTPPEIIEITAPIDPVQLGATVEISATFTDPDTGDTHDAKIDWGDGESTEGLVDGNTITGSYAYTTPGVYTLMVFVRDSEDATDEMYYQYVVVYDPDGGFVTGGGWIDSPEGAYSPEPSLTGKATFGFVSKYKKGADVPTGVTQFQFNVAGLTFHSNSYDWLVVAGKKAMYKGVGTINGEGNYAFMLSCIDGDLQGGDGIDRFRIKIWDKDTGVVIYDNQMGEVEDAEPATALSGGSIVVHKN